MYVKNSHSSGSDRVNVMAPVVFMSFSGYAVVCVITGVGGGGGGS